jgi:DNA ligase-1
MVFDLPEHRGPFEARMAELERLFPPVVGANARAQRAAGALGAHVVRVQMVSQVECQDNAHLLTALENVIALGGEGLMLRKPGSHYEGRRSSTLLKLKRMHDDEATVISYLDGKGKHEGSMGALHCRLASGVEFDVGSGFTDKERDAPPRLGSKITFRYQEITRDGVPRFPVYLRPHHDV